MPRQGRARGKARGRGLPYTRNAQQIPVVPPVQPQPPVVQPQAQMEPAVIPGNLQEPSTAMVESLIERITPIIMQQVAQGTESGLVTSVLTHSVGQVMSYTDRLDWGIDVAVRAKIMKGDYVDLSHLLRKPGEVNSEDKQFCVVDGAILIKEKKSRVKITDLDMWTDAFLKYMSVYVLANPEATQGMLKYMHSVRLGAKRVGGLTWYDYDVQFRLKKEANQSIDWGCWTRNYG
ncbi:uncharacterized protein LOC110441520 [Mizuhopecten yessoensis]|uniref:uncharacterized protein LOC110441520 n=1 Tax=Mizuhopecten yessoensis TaxID=6573 RepID=UPI000B45E8DF|nr:uncharacterized protein LOC110441520 [Mizuhopecten yessoensis]